MDQVEVDQRVSQVQLPAEIAQRMTFNDQGLVPVVVQSVDDSRVLMLAWMDQHALAYSLQTKDVTYWSRSRGEYWVKGLTSGNTQRLVSCEIDCDGDSILIQVVQHGPACHNGTESCFDTFQALTTTEEK